MVPRNLQYPTFKKVILVHDFLLRGANSGVKMSQKSKSPKKPNVTVSGNVILN